MKKGFQKILLMLIGLCVLVAIFNFIVPVDVLAYQGNGCYGEVVYDAGYPQGWDCECGDFVDCWKRIEA